MKRFVPSLIALCALPLSLAARPDQEYRQKEIYIPKIVTSTPDRQPENWEGWNPAKWSFSRMLQSENVALFWAPGFGSNPATAPDFIEVKESGDTVRHNMKVDVMNLMDRLERFYAYFSKELGFTRPGSNTEKYKMMVMLDYSLEGTAYGGEYDHTIGALWITPGRLRDPKLNCIAHELGHSFQSQITCDGLGEAWGGCGFFEMASQWMLLEVNPDWQTDENYHLNNFRDKAHKAFLHIDNIYRSPYVLCYWSQLRGQDKIAELFRQGKRGEDPAMTYMRMFGLSQEQFNDEMWQAYAHCLNWDFDKFRANARPYANKWNLKTVKKGCRLFVAPENAPENYGFNALAVTLPTPGTTVTAHFRGEAGLKGYYTPRPKEAGWRYGFVVSMADGSTRYGEMKRDNTGQVSVKIPEGATHLWFLVTGAPTRHRPNIDGPDNPGDPQWPWSVRISNSSTRY